jgi:hypothetical protein
VWSRVRTQSSCSPKALNTNVRFAFFLQKASMQQGAVPMGTVAKLRRYLVVLKHEKKLSAMFCFKTLVSYLFLNN